MQARESAEQREESTKETVPSAQPRDSPKQLVRVATPEETAGLLFPENGYVGIAAEFADAYASRFESPKEFFYMDLLVLIGAFISGRVRADIDLPCQPRLYALKIGRSAWRRKSTTTGFAAKFFRDTLLTLGPVTPDPPFVVKGVGSAEGLAGLLKPQDLDIGGIMTRQNTRRLVLSFDEFRRFEAKASIQGSALRPIVNELYESNGYDNVTKDSSIHIADGHLGFVSNTTEENFKRLVNASEFVDIGFLNRFLLVPGDSRKRVPRPKAPPESLLGPIREELVRYIKALPALNGDGSASQEVIIPLTPGAQSMWDHWYGNLEESEETARLDSIGMRLMSLFAFTSGQSGIREGLLRSVLDILEWQRKVRSIYRPIVADNADAEMEQKILRELERRGALTTRDLRRFTNADRTGLAVFNRALERLCLHGEVKLNTTGLTYELAKGA
jgi:hypothetical protein